MEVAHRLQLPLKLGGKIDETDRHYFEEEVKPRLEWDGMEFVGEVSFEEKLELYRHAIAVVYPVAFEEPFGLVMAEALASGTPVMAFDRGAVREILDDGETAIVGATVDDLVDRFPEIERINRATCRHRARERFDIKRMVDGYESAYARVLASAGALVAAQSLTRLDITVGTGS
jgi:glycosyltransferase involved in cell wall biosynthesis